MASEERLVDGGKAARSPIPSCRSTASRFITRSLRSHGADIYKIHVPSRKIVQVDPRRRPQSSGHGRGQLRETPRFPGPLDGDDGPHPSVRDVIYNTGPCPVPGGKVVFTSNRHGFVPRLGSFTSHTLSTDRHGRGRRERRDDRAPEPRLRAASGRFSRTAASCSARWNRKACATTLHWGMWTHPSGRHALGSAGQRISAGACRRRSTSRRSCPTARSSSRNITTSDQRGFGTYVKFPVKSAEGQPSSGRAIRDTRAIRPLPPARHGRRNAPLAVQPVRPRHADNVRQRPDKARPTLDPPRTEVAEASARVTHPCGAPDNHLLTVWSPGPA